VYLNLPDLRVPAAEWKPPSCRWVVGLAGGAVLGLFLVERQ